MNKADPRRGSRVWKEREEETDIDWQVNWRQWSGSVAFIHVIHGDLTRNSLEASAFLSICLSVALSVSLSVILYFCLSVRDT